MTLLWRSFGTTYHIAHLPHHCDCCNTLIAPGDYYERYVELKGDKIVVWKYHRMPDCPPDFFDFDEEELSDDISAANDNNKEHSNERAA